MALPGWPAQMSKRGKLAVLLVAIGLAALLSQPVATELEVQSAKRHLARTTSVGECIAEFGEPSRKADDEQKPSLGERLSLEIAASDEVLIFHREGLPYWAIYLVTGDGEVISDYAVDRFW